MMVPFISLVRSLNCITNWPMFTPCWPSAGPTGGAGVACPPGHWSFTFAVITFAIAASRMRKAECGMRKKRSRSVPRFGVRPDPPYSRVFRSLFDRSDLQFRIPNSALRIRSRLDPLHLPVFEIHRRRPVEDDQHDLDQAAGLGDLLDS